MKIEAKFIFSYFLLGLILAVTVVFSFLIGMRLGMLIIIIPLVTFFVGHFFAKLFSREMSSFQKSVRIVRTGNLEYKTNTHTDTEIGEISRDIDDMVGELNKSKVKIAVLSEKEIEQKNTIKQLEKQEDHFRSLFEQSNDAVFVYDFDGKMIDVNQEACKMLGYDKKTLMGIKFLDLHTEEELVASKDAFKTGTETCSVRFESKFKKSNGDELDVDISTSVVDLKKGVMQSIVSDITSRKRLQKALRESEEKFRTFMETANDFMYIANKKNQLIYVNSGMANNLGYTQQEMQKMTLSDIVHEEYKEEFEKQQAELVETGDVIYEPVWETKNRQKVYGELKAVSIYTPEGLVVGTRGVFRDISERKKIEQSQRLAQLGELSADVAHEVNNPITIISGHAELAIMKAGKIDKETLMRNMKVIVEQCETAKNIIKRLLMFSKPSKGDFSEYSVNQAIEEVINLVSHKFMSDNVKLNMELAEKVPKVNMDYKQIQEVLMNLFKNADEAMPEKGGEITVKTSYNDDIVKIEVKDTGSGISEEAMGKIFDPFFTTKEEGTGLGLSVCYGILKAHGGDLKYTSVKGEGTTATLLFPRT